eukprot:3678048-Rhodomonas_salina.1
MFNAGYIDSPRYIYLWYCYRYQSNVSYHWPRSRHMLTESASVETLKSRMPVSSLTAEIP